MKVIQSKEDTVKCLSFPASANNILATLFIENVECDYSDEGKQQLGLENMYGLSRIDEALELSDLTTEEREGIQQIKTLMDKQNASYFRFIDFNN